jgi:CheY-like chemotaxis protein
MIDTLTTSPSTPALTKPTFPRCRKVLIVEDDDAGAQVLRIGLGRLGHMVAGIAKNGKDALAMAAETQPEVILMDINIPGFDGIDTARRLRLIGDFAIVFTTGCYDDAVLKRTRTLGPVSYLVKPFSPAQLKATLELL